MEELPRKQLVSRDNRLIFTDILEYGIYQVPAREVDERNNGSLFTMEEGGRRARREKFSRLNFPARERDVLDAVLMSDRVHRASNAGC